MDYGEQILSEMLLKFENMTDEEYLELYEEAKEIEPINVIIFEEIEISSKVQIKSDLKKSIYNKLSNEVEYEDPKNYSTNNDFSRAA